MALNKAPQARRPGKDALPFANGFAPATANMITKLVFHECSVPFQVYVETFLPCFIQMVITIVSWDISDIIRNSAESIVEQPLKGASKRKGHIKRVLMSPTASPEAQKGSRALGAVLKWTEPLERIGYVMLLYHATEQFSRSWMTMLYNFEHCGKPESEGPFQAHCEAKFDGATGTPVLLSLPIVDQNRANWAHGLSNCALPFGNFSVTLEATFENIANNEAYFSVGFFAGLTTGILPYQSEKITIGPGQTGTVTLHREIYAPLLTGTDLIWWTECQPVPIGQRILSASISIFQFQPGRQ